MYKSPATIILINYASQVTGTPYQTPTVPYTTPVPNFLSNLSTTILVQPKEPNKPINFEQKLVSTIELSLVELCIVTLLVVLRLDMPSQKFPISLQNQLNCSTTQINCKISM